MKLLRQSIIFRTIIIVYVVICAAKVLSSPSAQQDFSAYYYAAKASAQGLNPYDLDCLSSVAGKSILMPYCYPPLFLGFFRWLTPLSYDAAKICFFLIKIFVFFGLAEIWRRFFLRSGVGGWFYFLLFFGFNSAVFLDLFQGNITVFEQFFLWLGFGFFLRKRYGFFCALILIASAAKLVLGVFLALLLVTDYPKRRLYFLSSVGILSLWLFTNYAANPASFNAFIATVRRNAFETGDKNPSLLAAWRDLIAYFLRDGYRAAAHWMVWFLYPASTVVVMLCSVRRMRSIVNAEALITLAALTYMLIMPRFKDYSFILLIVPAYRVLMNIRLPNAGIIVAMIFLVFGGTPLMPMRGIGMWVCAYQSFLFALLLWGALMFQPLKEHHV